MATGGERFKAYKTKGLDVEEVRRRKVEEGVQLRKTNRDDQLAKRRNLQIDEPDVEEHAFPEDTPLDILSKALYNPDVKEQLKATTRFRKCLSVSSNPPIKEVIDTGAVPQFVHFLTNHEAPLLQFEAAWVLTNIASGSSHQTRIVIDMGAVPLLVLLIQSPHESVKEQVVWALGNIAGDSPACRDEVLKSGVMAPLLSLLRNPGVSIQIRRNGIWTLSNLCRGKDPRPDFSLISECIPVVAQHLHDVDVEVLVDACWTATFLTDGNNTKIQKAIDGGLCRRLVELLFHPDKRVVGPALRAVGNMVTGDDVQTQVVINCSVLPALQQLLASPHENIQKEACWAISNITAGNRVQIQAVVDSNLFPPLLEIMNTSPYKTRKEAVWAVLNATSGGTHQQIRYLVSIGCIKPLCDMLGVPDPRVIQITLEGLENILKVGQLDVEKNGGINPFAVLIEETFGLDKIEYLQNNSSEKIYQMAYRIIEHYFSTEEDADSTIAPQTSDGGQFVFSNNPNSQQGEFRF